MLDDIEKQVQQSFSVPDREAAIALLQGARIHDGSFAEPRLQRCALVASGGSLEKLRYYVEMLKVDYRDVIVAGEYESAAGKLVRRSLSGRKGDAGAHCLPAPAVPIKKRLTDPSNDC